jgi:molybdenum cofactor biosynthesis protein B
MVDFQSRDTRRGPTTDHESDAESTDTTADDAVSDAEGNEADTVGTDAETATDDPPAVESGESNDTAVDDPLGDPGETAAAAEPVDAPAAETVPPASKAATPARSVDVAVVTVADDRAALEDAVTAAFETAGHAVVRRERLRGGYDGIQQMVDTLVGRGTIDVVVTVGGVGLAADEMAVEAVHPLLEKALPGFGEAFRARLSDHVGTGIVGVRSAAGVSDGTLVFCLPGDAEAAALAVREILTTEAPELLAQLEE